MRYEIFFCTVSMVTLTTFGYWRIVCQLQKKIKKKLAPFETICY